MYKKMSLFLRLVSSTFSFRFARQSFDAMIEFVIENVYEIRKMKIGEKSSVSSSARFMFGENIEIGHHTNINRNCMIWASKNSKIKIGNNCLTGPRVSIFSSKYKVKGRDIIRSYSAIEKDVVIGNDVWLGANVIILPGVNIGDGAIIGSGVVVTKNILPYTIYVGKKPELLRDR